MPNTDDSSWFERELGLLTTSARMRHSSVVARAPGPPGQAASAQLVRRGPGLVDRAMPASLRAEEGEAAMLQAATTVLSRAARGSAYYEY